MLMFNFVILSTFMSLHSIIRVFFSFIYLFIIFSVSMASDLFLNSL